MGMKRIQPPDDFDQRVQSGRSTAAQEQVLAPDKVGEIAGEILGGFGASIGEAAVDECVRVAGARGVDAGAASEEQVDQRTQYPGQRDTHYAHHHRRR